MLTVKKIHKVFKTDFWKGRFTAIREISFSIEEGNIVGFLGANGAGKTTLLRIIMGFTKTTSGNVAFSSRIGNTESDIKRNIGFLPERPYFYPDLTGRDFLNFMGGLCELSSRDLRKAISYWAPRFKIDFALDRKIKTYSKGMLQRVGFCSVLLHNPQLIILDEPLSGLDPIGRKELKDAIIEVNSEGKTIFFSSHIVPDVEEICEKVIFIEEGKLLYDGSIDEIILDNKGSMYQIKVLKDQKSANFKWTVRVEESDNYFTAFVPRESCQEFVKSLLNFGVFIESLVPVRLTLEEIFYKIKNQEREIYK